MRISAETFALPYWRYVTKVGNSIILWLYLINAIVYTFSPALTVSKNPANVSVVAVESTNVNQLNSTELNDQKIVHEFEFKSPNWTDIRLTVIEVTISILGYCCALDIIFSC